MASKDYELDVSKFILLAILCGIVIVLLLLASLRWEDEFTVMNGLRIVICLGALYALYSLAIRHYTMARAIERLVNECDVQNALKSALTTRAEALRNQKLKKHKRLTEMYQNNLDSDDIRIECDMYDSEIEKSNIQASHILEAARELRITNLGTITAYVPQNPVPAASQT